eukprot:CAMPEP_0172371038 /NCGR_PEP_ID=MMETSP1060-20121228/40833_1 /TAXON_ID=37318 /ORGANISM="Pseudo-nitzschia pungens, Strain cf. cingulata" /LENGTH=509 /DNA_ID=CAMNT_0013096533 /DNA_START=106 /DNA_END=1635 /DNA_ORIENTATION=+
MPPHLSYSGGRGSYQYRGRGRAGRGGRGRGGRTTYDSEDNAGNSYRASHGYSIDRRTLLKNNRWVRQSGLMETKNVGEAVSESEIDGVLETPKRIGNCGRDSGVNSTVGRGITDKLNQVPVVPQYAHAIMKKNGKNQLVLSSNQKARSIPQEPSSMEFEVEKQEQSRQSVNQCQTLTRTGRHKLVSLTSVNAAKAASETRQQLSTTYPSKDYKCNTFQDLKRRLPSGPTSFSTTKRVKLSKLHSNGVENKEFFGSGNDEELNTKEKETDDVIINPEILSTHQTTSGTDETSKGLISKQTEKLTDFAYKETSRFRQRATVPSLNLHWSKNNSKSTSHKRADDTLPTFNKHGMKKNMGLVRVHPNEQTPICPTFLRGIQCQDMYCRKRHDIPKEYAMPVCSFFQRHGQCLRGESCVFRHVKVNPRAVVCPSFVFLGFCEDNQCKMKHVRVATGTCSFGMSPGTSRQDTQLRKESLSCINTKSKRVYFRNNKLKSGGSFKFTKRTSEVKEAT